MSGRIAPAMIGAGFGDEGKGLAVDAIAARLVEQGDTVTVVRSNGGAQAGHGVARPDGTWHVFHHVAAGTMAGAGTQMSRHFVAHPMLLSAELRALHRLGCAPAIGMDPRAIITTPFDMILNQAAEMSRGDGRHGSTGLGFGEAIERSERIIPIRARDLSHEGFLQGALREAAGGWVRIRQNELGITDDSAGGTFLRKRLDERDAIISRFMEDVREFRRWVHIRKDSEVPGTILFEGAQGLDLDMDLGAMPHVTRSLTGLPNMIDIAREAGLTGIAPVYMTRAYRTRHGAGPLAFERDMSEDLDIVDRTNVTNAWQGRIRTAPLDLQELSRQVHRDIERGTRLSADMRGFTVAPAIGITCLDQIRDKVPVIANGQEVRVSADALVDLVSEATGLAVVVESHGPWREAVSVRDHLSADATAAAPEPG